MRTLFFVFFCFAAFASQAQSSPQKIGYADTEYIFNLMPQMKQIENELKTHSDQLQNQLKAKYTEYQAKLNAYNGMPATTPEAIKKDKETELTQLQENIQKFQQDAQASLQKKQTDLMEPIYAKISKTIEEVAKENGYTFIIHTRLLGGGGDILLYQDENYDISKLVLKKLGITPPAAAVTPVKQN